MLFEVSIQFIRWKAFLSLPKYMAIGENLNLKRYLNTNVLSWVFMSGQEYEFCSWQIDFFIISCYIISSV